MKATYNGKELIAAVEALKLICKSRILADTEVCAKDNTLTVRSYTWNRDAVIYSASIPAVVEEEGSCVVTGLDFIKVVKLAGKGEQTFDGKTIKGTASIAVKTFQDPGKNKIPLHDQESKTWLTLSASALHDLFVRTMGFVSDDETRYFMNGVLLESTDKGLRAVSTNGGALAMVDITKEVSPFEGNNKIIPTIGINLIKLFIKDKSSSWEIGLTTRSVKEDGAMKKI